MKDPTREQLIEYLAKFEDSEFDREEAIYWFANFWHGGQSSNLYSVLSTSPFKPGPLSVGCEPDSMAEQLFHELENEYCG